MSEKNIINLKAAGKRAEILIYEDIGEDWLGGISAKAFAEQINDIGQVDQIDVRINSLGGSVIEGTTIYNLLARQKARINVFIDGWAASIASVIAMAGDTISMADNGFLMMHDPWIVTAGTADDLREQAALLDKSRAELIKTYAKRRDIPPDVISDWMTAETWFNSAEALNAGLIDEIDEPVKMAAHAGLKNFKHPPKVVDFEKHANRAKIRKSSARAALNHMKTRLRQHEAKK